jgi:NADH:ubiquinone oxidoreductase subunit F (NADH-binding)
MFSCREGTGWMEKVLHRIENGHGREEDIDLLLSIQSKMKEYNLSVETQPLGQ